MHVISHNVLAPPSTFALKERGWDTAPHAGATRSPARPTSPRIAATYQRSDKGAVEAATRRWKMASRDMVAALLDAAKSDGGTAVGAAASAFARAVAAATRRLQVAAGLIHTDRTGTPPPPTRALRHGVSSNSTEMRHAIPVPFWSHSLKGHAGEEHPPSAVDDSIRRRLRRNGKAVACPLNEKDWQELLNTWTSPTLYACSTSAAARKVVVHCATGRECGGRLR